MQAEIICNMGNKNCFAIMNDKWSFSFKDISHLKNFSSPFTSSIYVHRKVKMVLPRQHAWFFLFAQMSAFCLFQFIVCLCEGLKTLYLTDLFYQELYSFSGKPSRLLTGSISSVGIETACHLKSSVGPGVQSSVLNAKCLHRLERGLLTRAGKWWFHLQSLS